MTSRSYFLRTCSIYILFRATKSCFCLYKCPANSRLAPPVFITTLCVLAISCLRLYSSLAFSSIILTNSFSRASLLRVHFVFSLLYFSHYLSSSRSLTFQTLSLSLSSYSTCSLMLLSCYLSAYLSFLSTFHFSSSCLSELKWSLFKAAAS